MHANSLVTIFRLMKLTRDENVTLFNLSIILNSSFSFLFPISDPSTYNINQSSICHKITHVIHIIQENLIQICHLDFKSSSINLRKQTNQFLAWEFFVILYFPKSYEEPSIEMTFSNSTSKFRLRLLCTFAIVLTQDFSNSILSLSFCKYMHHRLVEKK